MLAATLAAGLLGACGSSDELVPASQARAIDESLQRVAEATTNGDCEAATAALADAQAGFDQLPSSVDTGLRERILAGLEQLNQTVPEQCDQSSLDGTEDPLTAGETGPGDVTTVDPPETIDPPVTTEPPAETVLPTDTTPAPDPGGVSPDVPPGPDGQGPPGQDDGVPPGQEDQG